MDFRFHGMSKPVTVRKVQTDSQKDIMKAEDPAVFLRGMRGFL